MGILDFLRRESSEPVEHGPFASPVVFGRVRGRHRRNVSADIRTIHANAGEMPVEKIADAMGLRVSQVKSLAASQHPPIDLTLKKEPEGRGE